MAKLVRQQTATLLSSVRVRLEPPFYAQVAKLVDAQDLKSCGPLKSVPVRFRPWAPFKKCLTYLNEFDKIIKRYELR